jgi:hypothetical protein
MLAVGSCGVLRADFTYQETTQMTGGSLMQMMNAMGPFMKQAREPIVSTNILKGNRMASVTKDHVSVIDLDKETITTIDNAKKTYTVMTFEQMKQMLQNMQDRMASKKDNNGVEAKFNVSAKATGQTKTVQGLSAKEMLIEMAMEGTDTKSGKSGAMNITTDAWYAPVPGYDEVKAFHERMAVKLGRVFGSGMGQISQMSMGQPGMQQGMEQVAKELAKVDGVPVESVVKMGGEAAQAAAAQAADANAKAAAATCSAAPPAQQQQSPSIGSAIGGAAIGKLPGFGGFGRKKNNDQQQQAAQQPDQANCTPAAGQSGSPQSGSLMEMTMVLTGFSSGPADTSKFDIPAGYKQVEQDKRMGGR